MADNLAITAGSGTTIATDDVGGVHYQKIKLVNGTADDATAVPLPTALTSGGGLKTGLVDALPAGTNAIGKLAANSGVDIGDVDVTSLPAIPAGNNNIGDVDIASIAAGDNNIGNVDIASAIPAGTNTIGGVNVKPATSGGLSTYHLVSAASDNATNIKASAGQVFGWYIYNSNAAARKVVFHNTAGTPTAGASVFFSIVIPATSGANVEFTNGIEFSTGIAITTVTGLADNDANAVGANDLVINLLYK